MTSTRADFVGQILLLPYGNKEMPWKTSQYLSTLRSEDIFHVKLVVKIIGFSK